MDNSSEGQENFVGLAPNMNQMLQIIFYSCAQCERQLNLFDQQPPL